MLITDHNARIPWRSSTAYILHEARVLKESNPQEIVPDQQVRRVYGKDSPVVTVILWR